MTDDWRPWVGQQLETVQDQREESRPKLLMCPATEELE